MYSRCSCSCICRCRCIGRCRCKFSCICRLRCICICRCSCSCSCRCSSSCSCRLCCSCSCICRWCSTWYWPQWCVETPPHWTLYLHSAAHLQNKSVKTRQPLQTDAAKCSKLCTRSHAGPHFWPQSILQKRTHSLFWKHSPLTPQFSSPEPLNSITSDYY